MLRMVMLMMVIGLGLTFVGCDSSDENAKPVVPEKPDAAAVTASTQTVKAGCAKCIFKMEGVEGCELAVEVDGKKYLVEGVKIDALGDPHAADGLCSVEKTVEIKGKVVGDKYVATSVVLK